MVNKTMVADYQSINDLLIELHRVDVKLWVEDGKLRSDAPKGAITPTLRTQITVHRDELIKLLQQAEPDPHTATIVPMPRTAKLPLSFAQQRMWFLDQMGSAAAYNGTFALKLEGDLHIVALQKALQEIVRRHESLRTTFAMHEGEPYQVIHADMTITLEMVDLRPLSVERQAAEVQRLSQAEVMHPFDLSRDLMLRATLLRLGDAAIESRSTSSAPAPTTHVLLMTMHHIASDGWSWGIVVKELAALYAAFRQNLPSPLPSLPIQYADFAMWQRHYLQGEVREQQLRYWKTQLADAPTLLQLPTDRSRPVQQSFQGDVVLSKLDARLTKQLRTFSREQGVTLYTTLLTAFQIFMARYSGQTDLVVGSAIANRNRPEVEALIGFFVNTLALRLNLSDAKTRDRLRNASFMSILAQVSETVQAAYEYQDTPFEQVVEEVVATRSLNHNPLVQVMFVLQNAPMDAFTLSGLKVSPLALADQTTRFDLEIHFWEVDDYLQGHCVYSTDLFDRATIERLVGHFQTMLTAIMANPTGLISDFPLLTESERYQLLTEWNNTATDYPKDKSIHQLFEEQAQRTPDAIALVFGEEQLTYRALNERANQLAHHLRGLGVQSETLVGICMERSLEMVIGLLGILKAGGAYVPLDPSYPAERLAFMLEDTAIAVLLTQESLRSTLPNLPTILCLDTLALQESAADNGSDANSTPIPATNLAYVMYTSGSTGRPKGVSVMHQNVVRLVKATNFIQFSPADVFLQLAPISFDAATLEIWGPLLNGGQLVIMSPAKPSLQELGQTLEKHQITTLWLTAGLFHLMVDEQLASLHSLRWLLAGGDVLSVAHVQKAVQALPNCQLINGYGPTENTTFTCCHWIKAVSPTTSSIPIGRPIANTQVYILDKALQPVPIGVAGDLYAGGDGVVRGYYHNASLTAERFIPDPFAQQNPTQGCPPQLYRTGDVARWRPDGTIEFLGRLDNQVKLRGFRIELGEIEACLSQQPQIREAVVIVQEMTLGYEATQKTAQSSGTADKRIVAYIVGDGAIDPTTLRNNLHRHLPDYMIPAAIVQLAALPLTANGKVDRRALPAPELIGVASNETFVPPSTPTEHALAQIWCEVLGLERVGIHDNFFELGGHSLLATQVIAKIRRVFAVDLGLRTLFATPTIAAHAQALVAQQQQATQTLVQTFPAIDHALAQRHEPFPLTDVQHAYWIGRSGGFELGNVSAHVYFELDSSTLDVERLNHAWQQLIDRHEMLRAIIQPDGQQRILATVPPYCFAITDLTRQDEAATQQALAAIRAEMSHQVLPADQWPLFDIRVTRLSPTATRLHISLDALILDGSSMGILVTEWLALYQNSQAVLSPINVSFRDYVLAEKMFEKSAAYQQAWAYWERRLATLPPAPELPLKQEGQMSGQPRFHTHRWQLDAAHWSQLKRYGHRAGLTDSTIILSAFAEILTQWSKQAHFTLNLTLFNRLPFHPQINEIVGDFTPLLMLEVDNRPNQASGASFQSHAQRIQQQLWDDLDHRMVNGVQVLRELARRQGRGTNRVLMPVVFTSMLATAYDNALFAPLGGLSYMSSQTPQVWLDHGVTEAAGALDISWSVVEGLFPDGMIDAMFAAYQALLQRLATDETAWQEAHLSLLPQEQHQQRAAVNATAAPLSGELLHTLFLQQVEAHATDPAVITPVKSLTYQELYHRANQVGHWLRQQGAKPNTLVAVVMEKGWEQVVAVLGIHLAGAAYLPIDPTLPTERLHYLLAQGEAKLALTQTRVAAHVTWPTAITCLAVDPLTPDVTLPALDVVQTPTDLAYVIYTSGSTGLPKGVVIDHRGAVNTILDVNQLYGITATDRVLALSALNFDLSVYDIFGLLAVGGAIVLPDVEKRIEPSHWLELIQQHGVTVWDTVPALMQMLVDFCEQEAQMTNGQVGKRNGASAHPLLGVRLRVVMLSGDWIPVSLPDRIRALWPSAKLYGMGGATEASIWSIYYPIHAVDPTWPSIPYGKPMTNQTFHVLDATYNPRPTWAPGDLYIGGIGLALGYWKDAARTAASFVTHPRTGERLYKTGDLGRYLPDGNIEFLGRDDFQVKIRGHRIELGEIEAALLQHSSVRETVVSAIGNPKGNRELVAYVVRNHLAQNGAKNPGGGRLEQPAQSTDWRSQLQAHLAAKLPTYMVPALYVELDILPLTANGKVNRKELPSPNLVDLQEAFVAPCNQLEEQICAALGAILQVEKISTVRDFGELGVNSVHMVQVANHLRKALDRQIPLIVLFQHATVQALATYLVQTAEQAPNGQLPHERELEEQRIDMTRGQQRAQARLAKRARR